MLLRCRPTAHPGHETTVALPCTCRPALLANFTKQPVYTRHKHPMNHIHWCVQNIPSAVCQIAHALRHVPPNLRQKLTHTAAPCDRLNCSGLASRSMHEQGDATDKNILIPISKLSVLYVITLRFRLRSSHQAMQCNAMQCKLLLFLHPKRYASLRSGPESGHSCCDNLSAGQHLL